MLIILIGAVIIKMMGDILNQLITDNALCIFNDGSHTLFDSTRSEALDITFGNAHSLKIKIHSLLGSVYALLCTRVNMLASS